jgi:assimilatory nitrate reductase catalytic subunit
MTIPIIVADTSKAPSGRIGESSSSVASVCCYCGTGCGVRVHTQDGRVTGVSGDTAHPSSRGKLCSKGLALAETVRGDQSRVLKARWRPDRQQPKADIPLSEALDKAAGIIARSVVKHGPDSVGFYLSGQLLTEDYSVFNKLARALVGTNNIDTNSRLCMSSAVAGYKLTLGADAPPACYDDLDHAETVLIAGSNMAYAHPILFRRLEAARAARPDMKIIVIDPRVTDTASVASLHLPILPGTDVALFHAMLNVMIWEDLVDRDYIERHTEGFAALKARVYEFTPSSVSDLCGIPAADIIQAARWFGAASSAMSLYTMGLNQSANGTAKNAALINLHLATAQIGKPGAGPFSLTGQPNAMGGREVGALAGLLPGHRDASNPVHRAEIARLWNVDSVPSAPGTPALEMFDAVLEGRIKVLWIAATNPAQSMPDQRRVRAALEMAECVIVQDAFADAETLAYADLVLPAATWPEKEGTMTNSERRIGRVRAAIAPPGDAQPDWMLAAEVAKRLASLIAPDKRSLFQYGSAEDVFREHASTTAARDLDYSALTYQVLESEGPQQWPYRSGVQTTRLYDDGVFPTLSGRAHFGDVAYVPVAEPASAAYPIRLTTGRVRDHWHTMARTGLAPTLNQHVEEPWLGLHRTDLSQLRLLEGALVKIKSRRGDMILPAKADDSLRPGHAFLPMHWGSAFVSGSGPNALTNPVCDPISFQPELKHTAVAIEAAKLGWQAMAWVRGDTITWRRKLMPWLQRFPYAVVLPVASGVRMRLAAAEPPQSSVLHALAADLGLAKPEAAFDDPARGILRRLQRAEGELAGFLLAGDTQANEALCAWAEGSPPPENLARVLMGRGQAAKRSPILCVCFGVREQTIEAGIEAGLDLDGLKQSLKCGTGCGSCVPDIQKRLARRPLTENS